MYCEVKDKQRLLEREHELKQEELIMTVMERIITILPSTHPPYYQLILNK